MLFHGPTNIAGPPIDLPTEAAHPTCSEPLTISWAILLVRILHCEWAVVNPPSYSSTSCGCASIEATHNKKDICYLVSHTYCDVAV